MSGRGATLGGNHGGEQYGHKKNDVNAIALHFPPGTRTVADPFGGTGVVSHAAKGLGIRVMANDIMAFSHLRLRAFVENDSVVLDEEDVRLLTAPNPAGGVGTIEDWYGKALGSDNAAFLDGLAASLPLLDGEMKRDVAVCLAVLCVMRHMVFPAVKFGADGDVSGRRAIKGKDLRAEFRRMAIEEFPRLLRPGASPCKASRMDALDFVSGTECDVLYLDPPYPSPGCGYERDRAFYDKLVHALRGRPDLAGRPRTGLAPMPPHADFTRRQPALMGFNLLFKRAKRNASRVIFSYNSTAAVKPHEVIRAARDWYGGLAACEWTPGRRPTSGRRRKTTANVLMVFDRDRPTASPRWTAGSATFADLFCGVGGFRAALQAAGCRCVFSSEIEKNAVATYLANWGDLPSGDIRAISPDDVPEHQVLCAGFPCPAFSVSGKGGGYEDERGRLFFQIARIAAIRRPCVLLLENVSAFASSDKPWLLLAREALEGIGYRVSWKAIDAAEHGVRTARKRAYLVCFRCDLNVGAFDFPSPTREPVMLADIVLPDSETDDCVVRDPRIIIDERKVAEVSGSSALRPIPVGQIGEDGQSKQGYRIYSDRGIAVTFCAGGGGIGGTTGLYLVNGRVRRLHPRESARAMGFPDSFVLPAEVTARQACSLFGNSVAVPVIRRIFDRIAETLTKACP